MKQDLNERRIARTLTRLAFAATVTLAPQAFAASLNLANAPLATATTTTVLPNLMFILDNSGSMDWNYLPDWANDSLCKGVSGSYNAGCDGQPPFRSPDFNGVYYNPAIRYVPPVNADGSSKPSQTTWTEVKVDAYGIQSAAITNLVTSYPDIKWCTNDSGDCLRNGNYILPGIVNGKAYVNQYATTASGTGVIATGSNTTEARTFGPHYYAIIPGEYCDSPKLTNCQTTQTDTFKYPAKVRWCSDAAMTNCQSIRTSTYSIARYPTKYSPATTQITVNSGNTSSVSGITINGVQIMSGTSTSTNKSNTLASSIASRINDCTAAVTGNCGVAGYRATASSSTVTITAPLEAGALTVTPAIASNGPKTYTITAFSGYAFVPGSFQRVDIIPGGTYPPGSASKAPSRKDCAGATSCTYDEEMTNFANWYTYYQTRMQTMKTAASRAFKEIDNRYRVGFITIANQSTSGNYLPIARFDAGTGSQKEKWYNALFRANPSTSTPLRSALSIVGRIFAGKKPVGTADPMQYSCQQNFALLTTDGYWNTDSDSDVQGIDGNPVGNRDSDANSRPAYEGPVATSNSLADVAKYYYDTDLRDSAWGNCTGALGNSVCENNVFTSGNDLNTKQHLTTFTLGLGVDGTLLYTPDYLAGTSVDYESLSKGTGNPVVNWPVPEQNTERAVDDLWHAAVNGGGVYFSAKDPVQLTAGLNSALSAIGSKIGSGAAAATSTLNPVAGDNFAYVASYTTVKWKGNLEARGINLDTGVVSESASWCVENVVAGSCPSPGTIVAETSGSSTVYNCVTPDSTAATCGGTLDGTNCKVELPIACTGTMGSKVFASSDERTIYMNNGSGTLVPFNYSNLSTTGYASHFNGTSLSQWTLFDNDQKSAAAGENLVKFLRGQTGYEDRASNELAKRLFRYREATLGDAIESQPAYVGKPTYSYTDPGYSSFVSDKAGRPKTVFIGTNDGMLHAFDAMTGQERWAYVPSMVIPNMWKLADKNYATMHTNFVNGSPFIGDIYAGGSWRTILVAGLNGGGRGYYALDVTEPTAPSLLWEIDTTDEPNLGYTFGNPVITKMANGTWVVLFTSGYNNTSPGDGKGYLFVYDAWTGAPARTAISTEVGSTTTPSGLSKIAVWADNPERNNTAGYVYGGDLLGNVWRFDINTGVKTQFAVLKSPNGSLQPITAAPELGSIFGKRVVFVGTGKYLEVTDLTDTQVHSVYAIKDDDATATLVNPRGSLVQQTLSTSGATRTASSNPVNFKTGRGWFVDFPDSGERVNVNPRLDSGTLIVPTTVPSNTVCNPGGYGWLNYFNYETGSAAIGAEDSLVSQKFNAPIVGVNVYRLPNGKRITTVVTSDRPTPEKPPKGTGGDRSAGGFQAKRVIWREVTPERAH